VNIDPEEFHSSLFDIASRIRSAISSTHMKRLMADAGGHAAIRLAGQGASSVRQRQRHYHDVWCVYLCSNMMMMMMMAKSFMTMLFFEYTLDICLYVSSSSSSSLSTKHLHAVMSMCASV
jgi:hypothetical protein